MIDTTTENAISMDIMLGWKVNKCRLIVKLSYGVLIKLSTIHKQSRVYQVVTCAYLHTAPQTVGAMHEYVHKHG